MYRLATLNKFDQFKMVIVKAQRTLPRRYYFPYNLEAQNQYHDPVLLGIKAYGLAWHSPTIAAA